jgi:hypothetical protein
MSYFNGPKSITNGLVLCLDAANNKSYIGSGTTWNDLSGNNKTGTLTNGPTYTSSFGGGIVFDGVDDYATVSNPLNQSNLSQEWTVNAWFSLSSSPSNNAQYLVEGLNSGVAADWYANGPLLYLNGGADDYYTYSNLGSIIGGGIMNLTYRFKNSSGTRTIYKNSVNATGSGPNNTSTPSGQGANFRIGYAMKGNIYLLQIYNRVLSDTEVLQNFNANKGRFGL